MMFTLDLEQETWTKSSTNSGLFDGRPDQLVKMFGISDYLFFTEDAKTVNGLFNDLHGRNMNTGEYFTLVQAIDETLRTIETS